MLTPIVFFAYLDDENDQKLFEDIFYSYQKQMFVLALSILKKQEDAEDAVSDVFTRIASKNWDVVREIKSDVDLRNYLLKATKNTSLNRVKERRKTVASLDEVLEQELRNVQDLSDDSFVDAICDTMIYEDVLEAMQSLDEKYRDVLYYHFTLGMTVPETAKLLFQSVAATKKQLVRGKKMLLNILGIKGKEID